MGAAARRKLLKKKLNCKGKGRKEVKCMPQDIMMADFLNVTCDKRDPTIGLS